MIKMKRVYEMPARGEGFRILVDRLWARGLSKDKGKIDLWLKDIAPSHDLRKWYADDPKKWIEFKNKYFEELGEKGELVRLVLEKVNEGSVTLFFGSREKKLNNAVSLKEYMKTKAKEVR
jgi:uncharacterized protein YeaO (DUF488 family)